MVLLEIGGMVLLVRDGFYAGFFFLFFLGYLVI